jgi:hypothetical protein
MSRSCASLSGIPRDDKKNSSSFSRKVVYTFVLTNIISLIIGREINEINALVRHFMMQLRNTKGVVLKEVACKIFIFFERKSLFFLAPLRKMAPLHLEDSLAEHSKRFFPACSFDINFLPLISF